MIIQDANNRIFYCSDGEQITVNVFSKNTAHLVTYRLDASTDQLGEGEPLVFDLDKSQADPSLLTVGVHFSGPTGGAYAIQITGDPSGHTFTEIYRQNGVPVLFDHFTFDIWP